MRPSIERRGELTTTAERHLRRHHRARLLVTALDVLEAAPSAPTPVSLSALLHHFDRVTADAELRCDVTVQPGTDAEPLVAIDTSLVIALLVAVGVASHGVVRIEVTPSTLTIAVTDQPGTDPDAETAVDLVFALIDHAGLETGAGRIVLPFVSERRSEPRTTPRVLVVEDNPTNQILATKQLERLGAEPVLAETGRLAVEMAATETFDLILMDWNLPDIDGLEVTGRIRAGGASAESPIVAMTANAMAGDREACLAAGMNDFLSKPVRMEAISDVVTTWTQRSTRVDPVVLGHRLATDLGGRDVARAVTVSFLDELDPRVDAIVDGDGDLRRRAAHTLKSTAALLALDELSATCADIELGRTDLDADELRRQADAARALLRLTLAGFDD